MKQKQLEGGLKLLLDKGTTLITVPKSFVQIHFDFSREDKGQFINLPLINTLCETKHGN